MKLAHLIQQLPVVSIQGTTERMITMVSQDTRENFTDATLYCAVSGTKVDGHDYIDQAIAQGATVIVCQHLPHTLDDTVTYLVLDEVHSWIGVIASHFYGNPSRDITMIGVTGTNGKTSVTHMVHESLLRCGKSSALVGTISNKINNQEYTTEKSTPSPIELHAFIRKAVDAGCKYLSMEVSSHALDQQRVAGISFDIAVFTNLTQDHLDYHKTMERYAEAKKLLFDHLDSRATALVNIDDTWSSYMVSDCRATIVRYGKASSDFTITREEHTLSGMNITINETTFHTNLIGTFNAYNLTTAYGVLSLLGINEEQRNKALSLISSPAGRLEIVPTDNNYLCVVDYAHTPDALKNVLVTLKERDHDRLFCVFGCGGDRDTQKRPQMAAIAEQYADIVIVTNDNPRTEDPQSIINNIEQGFTKSSTGHAVILDRKKAIEYALNEMRDNDILLVAGKGHETYQIVGTTKHHFDDREVILGFHK
jgi:UDP-N-acetylmuramoyl-L-alanyl-D-glutamate--2,6-diaminopimelate ligase